MSDLGTQLREYMDATAPPVELEEIINDENWVPAADWPHRRKKSMTPGWVAAAAAVITLLLLGPIPLFSGSQTTPPADTMPDDGTTAPFRFTATVSEPLEADGPLVWRTVQVPSSGVLFTGPDGRFYQVTDSILWVSDDAVEWEGYRIDVVEGEWPQDLRDDRWMFKKPWPDVPLSWLFDLSTKSSGRIERVEIPPPVADFELLTLGPKGAIGVAGDGRIWHTTNGETWTESSFVAVNPITDPDVHAIAYEDGFLMGIAEGCGRISFSPDGIRWETLERCPQFYVHTLSEWGGNVVALGEFSVWQVTRLGSDLLYESPVILGDYSRGAGDLGILAVGNRPPSNAPNLWVGRDYAYSPDGVDWQNGTLPEGWRVPDDWGFIPEKVIINNETILVLASGPDGDTLDGNLVLMATP